MKEVSRGVGPGAGQQEAPVGKGFAPGYGRLLAKVLAGRRAGSDKKQSGRTPMEPKKAPAHHLNRWRDEGRGNLVLAGIRLGVLSGDRAPVGRGGEFRTWKSLAVAVEEARKALDS